MRTVGSKALQAYGHLCDTFALRGGELFSAACTLRHPNPVFTLRAELTQLAQNIPL